MTLANRDVVVQLRPREAELINRCLKTTLEMLELTSEFLPVTTPIITDRMQELANLRGLMHRIRDAPGTDEYMPREVGGVILLRAETGRVVAWGPNMEHICGWSSTEMTGEVGWQIMNLPDTRVEAFMERLTADKVVQEETDIPTKWGRKTRVFFRAELCDDMFIDGHTDHFVLAHIWPV